MEKNSKNILEINASFIALPDVKTGSTWGHCVQTSIEREFNRENEIYS
jgi:hypothetical protein